MTMASDLLVWPHLRNPALSGVLLFQKDMNKLEQHERKAIKIKTLHHVRDKRAEKT